MASVPLRFVPPNDKDLTTLLIFEGPASGGPFTQIESVSAIGTYPNYITEYTTDQAVSDNDWFSIRWVDNKNALTEFSNAVQGHTQTLVGKLTANVLLRDATLDDNIVSQVAEWVVARVMHTDEPWTLAVSDATFSQVEGMTLLILARSTLHSLISSSSGESYTAGLVSQKAGGTTTLNRDVVKALVDEANMLLGISFSLVMLLEDIDPIGLGTVSTIGVDQSRLLISIE